MSRRILIVALLLLLSGCVRYSFKGALPSYLQTIAIPVFEDRSRWAGLQEKMTQDVINAFIEDNSLRLIERQEDADLLLLGEIQSVRTRKTAITPNAVVEEEQLVVTVKVDCIDQQAEKSLWTSSISDFGVVSGSASLEEQDLAIAEAVEKIVEEILNRTVAAW